MKRIKHLIVLFFLLAFPLTCNAEVIAFSPSITGQPLIFHINRNLDPILSSQFSAASWAQLQNALLIQSSYFQHLDNVSIRNCCACSRNCCPQWDFWAQGMGQWQQQNSGHQHYFGYNDTTGGITLGADICCNDFLVGAAASYTNSNLRWKRSAGDCQINSYYCGAYGNWDNGCFYLNAAILGAYSDYRTSRHLQFVTIERYAQARHNSWEALTGFEAGIALQELFCNVDFVPFVGIDYVYLSQEGYREHGTRRFNLNVKSHDDQLLQSELGIQLTRCIQYEFCCRSWLIAPTLSLSYINQTPLARRVYNANFVGRDFGLTITGWDFERKLGEIDFSLNILDFTETINFAVEYNGQFGCNYWNQSGSLTLNVCF